MHLSPSTYCLMTFMFLVWLYGTLNCCSVLWHGVGKPAWKILGAFIGALVGVFCMLVMIVVLIYSAAQGRL
jgi:hypothetical protein